MIFFSVFCGVFSIGLLWLIIYQGSIFFNHNNNTCCMDPLLEDREIKSCEIISNVLSLNETITNDLMKEALLINFEQVELNELIASGDLSDKTLEWQIEIEGRKVNLANRTKIIGLAVRDRVS